MPTGCVEAGEEGGGGDGGDGDGGGGGGDVGGGGGGGLETTVCIGSGLRCDGSKSLLTRRFEGFGGFGCGLGMGGRVEGGRRFCGLDGFFGAAGRDTVCVCVCCCCVLFVSNTMGCDGEGVCDGVDDGVLWGGGTGS